MKLDYIPNINTYKDDLVRLYAFNQAEAKLFRDKIHQVLVLQKNNLALESLDFIESRNCKLMLRLADSDEGITSEDATNFFCDLTLEGYINMLELLKPFCSKETKGHQYLYSDIDSPTDFLFSPAGTWE